MELIIPQSSWGMAPPKVVRNSIVLRTTPKEVRIWNTKNLDWCLAQVRKPEEADVSELTNKVSLGLAQNIRTGSLLLAMLSRHKLAKVRVAVAKNPQTCQSTLEFLATDKNNMVRDAAYNRLNGTSLF